MPVDSQNLYFHLGMAADDDGVVEAWSVLKSIGSAEDNLRVLASKGLVKVLNEDLVSYILDWNEHNQIRSDRLIPSAYRELLVQILPDVELIEPRQRADRPLILGQPRDVPGTAQDRIGKDSSPVAIAPVITIENEEKPKNPSNAKYPHALEVFCWFPRPQKSWEAMRNVQEREYAEFLWERGEEKVKSALAFVESQRGNPEFMYSVVKPSDLEKKWEDIRNWKQKYG